MMQDKIDVFICCSSKDLKIADELCSVLDKEKISYFIERDYNGEYTEVPEKIAYKINNSELFLFIASKNSYSSEYHKNQLLYADRQCTLVSYVIDNSLLPLDIDFMFGFMEWFDVYDHPIDPILMDHLLMMLGRGYRKSILTEREKYLLSLPDEDFVRFEESGKYGYKLKTTGEVVIPNDYDKCDLYFQEGLAKVELHRDVGFVDKTGAEVVPLEYDGAESFSNGLAMVISEGGFGFVDKVGRVVIPLEYGYANSFSEGLALVSTRDTYEYGFINNKGEMAFSPKFQNAHSFSEGLASVMLDGKWGFIDKSGKMIIPPIYDEAIYFSEGLAYVKLNDKWGYIDKTGKVVIPIQLNYDSVCRFQGGMACVKLNRKYGFIDKNGDEVIPVKYDFNILTLLIGFANGKIAKVELNGEEFFIDKNGNRVEE